MRRMASRSSSEAPAPRSSPVTSERRSQPPVTAGGVGVAVGAGEAAYPPSVVSVSAGAWGGDAPSARSGSAAESGPSAVGARSPDGAALAGSSEVSGVEGASVR